MSEAVKPFEVFTGSAQPQLFATEEEAIAEVNKHESGEVRNWTTDTQVYVKFPIPQWV